MKFSDSIFSSVTLVVAIIVAAYVCAQRDGVNDTFRIVSAAALAVAAILIFVRQRKVAVPIMALIAPWTDIIIMSVVFLIWGGSFANS
ncbi:hypothetical protein GC584_06970 [Corynebacterium sp. zg912]|uniref:Uncharacterized protein n=1 Tax=Corynebacterium wankanglinii TaxID=2735136 RepID=A0A7V8UUU3_9CORY|nr:MULTISPECIES: hypothetical protein [Corynebacterium]MBA1837737.1 hypothetical protein [Corynebacterium wankanglinii]MCR5929158.1 hypothetical protein [Corynebacterium sp. zg912]MDL0403311.1 hypothetical protein [Corynebacterium lehmanniae]